MTLNMWSASKIDEPKEKNISVKNTERLAKALGIVIEMNMPGPFRYDMLLGEIQIAIVINMLKHSRSIQDCANKLGIQRTRLKMYMKKSGIEKNIIRMY